MKRSDTDINLLSPMMKQYMEIKDNYLDELLFFRLGDFYELFFEDAEVASRELELTLTGKSAGLPEKIKMCGVPFHSVTPYIEKLLAKGYKVAICEQLEDAGAGKKIVKRGVTQVLSRGTIVDWELLNSYENNYIGSVLDLEYAYVLTYADISTGLFKCEMLAHNKEKLLNKILALGIKEIILEKVLNAELTQILKDNYGIGVTIISEILEKRYEDLYKEIEDERLVKGIKHLLYYLVVKELKDLSHMDRVEVVDTDEFLEMDIHTIRNLELLETVRGQDRTNSLIWLLDKTKTAMGSRTLKNFLLYPLRDMKKINARYDILEKYSTEFQITERIRELLNEIYDLERLVAKTITGNLNARDLLQIRNSLKVLPSLRDQIIAIGFKPLFATHDKLFELLEKSIYENPPITIKEGSLIKAGFNKELDELKEVRSGGKEYLAELEARERSRTGIKNLKLGYTRVFGYYIEVTKGQLDQIKPDFGYERRQTLTNAERFISPELKEKEAMILNAEEKIVELEYNLFLEIKETVKKEIINLKKTAREISEIDALISLSKVSDENKFVRPILTVNSDIHITDGRHPVIEKISNDGFVPNDVLMPKEVTTLLITGPNMSGKSTYMRQLAMTIIMAQMGCFIPATEANIPVFDKIFTRIGASDDLVSGESTFMVEMLEAKNAITNATKDSLILFDELGRGTATYDGMALAEAILEYVNANIKCKTLFSTHYHELTELENKIPTIKNVHVAAHEENGNITFLHKVRDGAVDKSYGIHVAKLAKMPDAVIKRANEILKFYENKTDKKGIPMHEQIHLLLEEKEENQVIKKLSETDPLKITPLESITVLCELKELAKNEEVKS